MCGTLRNGSKRNDSRARGGTGARGANALAFLALLCGSMQVACSGKDTAIVQSTSLIGAPCVPYEETVATFSGNGLGLSVYLDSPACGGDICLSYYFQGRVTCPYGQTDEEVAALPATASARCRLPDASGNMTQQPVTASVPPQLVARRPETSVYCSCACSGTDSSQKYCTCPTNMRCEQFGIPNPRSTTTGVCVRLDSLYDAGATAQTTCSKTGTDPATDCGNNRQNP